MLKDDTSAFRFLEENPEFHLSAWFIVQMP